MIDKLIIRAMMLILVVFILLAILYERPGINANKRADYLPAKGFVGVVLKGSKLFSENCIQCHGISLQGTQKGPPLIHSYYRPEHHGDLAIYLAVYRGVSQHHWQFGDMPAMKQLTPEDAGHLLLFIRTEQKKAGLF